MLAREYKFYAFEFESFMKPAKVSQSNVTVGVATLEERLYPQWRLVPSATACSSLTSMLYHNFKRQ